MTALRPCLRPGCPELVDTGYCQTHRPAYRSLQTDATTRGYGHRWAQVSTAYRRAHPTCERCHQRPATLVHHLDGLGPLGPQGFDPANLEAVCRRCHSHAHQQLRVGARQGAPTHARRTTRRGTTPAPAPTPAGAPSRGHAPPPDGTAPPPRRR